jgi:mycothiol system anti-sigma-R factor
MQGEQQPGSGQRGHEERSWGSVGCGRPGETGQEATLIGGGSIEPYEPCQEAIATLYSFLDGELTPERREKIQRHLDDCGPCFEAFGFEAELKAVIARKCHEEVPASLRQRVAEVLRAEGARS